MFKKLYLYFSKKYASPKVVEPEFDCCDMIGLIEAKDMTIKNVWVDGKFIWVTTKNKK